jgi:hypothetical protein
MLKMDSRLRGNDGSKLSHCCELGLFLCAVCVLCGKIVVPPLHFSCGHRLRCESYQCHLALYFGKGGINGAERTFRYFPRAAEFLDERFGRIYLQAFIHE